MFKEKKKLAMEEPSGSCDSNKLMNHKSFQQ